MIGRLFNRQRDGLQVRRLFDASSVRDVLEQNEPRSSQAISDLTFVGLRPWQGKLWTISDGATLLGIVYVVRRAFDLWAANVLLLDPRASAVAARIVDRSKAISLNGLSHDVATVLPLLKRLHFANNLPFVVSPYPHDVVDAPTDGTRVGTMADLDALVDLYRDYEYGYEVTIGQLRTTLRHVLRDQSCVVAESEGRVVGATLIVGRTSRYCIVDALTVHPSVRQSGVTWRIGARSQAVLNDYGLSAIAFLAPSNPIVIESFIQDDAWLTSRLYPRRRFPGHNRLRTILYRTRARRHRTPELFRDPNDSHSRYIAQTQHDNGKVTRDS
jgi:N-acetylglutamate synthase-like GNAT family acetyltransferase